MPRNVHEFGFRFIFKYSLGEEVHGAFIFLCYALLLIFLLPLMASHRGLSGRKKGKRKKMVLGTACNNKHKEKIIFSEGYEEPTTKRTGSFSSWIG